jgi:hypothetical protein
VRPEAALLPAGLAEQVPAAAVRLGTPRGVVGVSGNGSCDDDDTTPTTTAAAAAAAAAASVVVNTTLPMGSKGEVHVPKVFGDRTVVLADGAVEWVGPCGAGGVRSGCSEDDGCFVVFATAVGCTFASFEVTTAAAAAATALAARAR